MRKKIEAVIFDWAGTTVDYGCFAPLEVFVKVFKEAGIDITYDEARKPMGMLKIDHIKALLKMERINALWIEKYGRDYNEKDINSLYERFEEVLFKSLENFAEPVPGILDLQKQLREKGIKIGSTTGYTKEMLDIVAPKAKTFGYCPDFRITSTEVPAGRPYPYMIYENMITLAIPNRYSVIKIGDTTVDMKEGKNAGVWAVGILKGGSELGLSQNEVETMDPTELKKLMDKTARRLYAAGADYVVDEVKDLIHIIDVINEKMNLHSEEI
ncbi:phosphonoacetaldehyde hydrolase [Cetobacterium sp. 8H]|uniref:phosphonoacetaldehyde hydrolase n=1 Tax=Cetobacterium sp. 8H TaxID=2759681 RepID=UPI00163D3A8A|nr:phosphonoacetaldehyde hydrolase [Cetobacterium sp. 8H]MBC2851768.1 phosphonoacetaldehyde hydrolase [Cetobacterium sp. 8H]